jgi:branched-chain amino acid transport system ATP-binding protein
LPAARGATTGATKVLEIRGLGAGYGEVEVLWDVDLDVKDEEIVALVGSNGAGKTTILRAVSGMLAPSAGHIRWQESEIGGRAPEQIVVTGIAHVPEGRRLFAGLSVKENLLIGAYHRRDSGIDADLDRVVQYFPRLGERLGQIAGRLSGGEQQMCAIGRGLMARPRLIMIDELSLGLAPKIVDELLERMAEVRASGTSILLVEQDVDAALHAAARAYVLETGRIVAEGTSEELLEDPRVKEAYLGVA